ncbi:hypothetical protein NQ318_020556 [Aromia moschata]|uniref:Mos1 transposase HTH domain-containing protein n=1 Tax=Aromia moschata TaxID=1265417 RepID=A0AAV8Z323_9CUCU|nr:hypothetical protein NQ318_020556 [Aromia moschata]
MLSVQIEQRVYLTFLVKLGKTFTEAYAISKEVYGNDCLFRGLNGLSGVNGSEWFKRFKEGRETTEDDPRLGQPSTIQGPAEITGINQECVRQILHELFNMRKVCAKMMPKLLTPEQKESIMNI